MSMKAEILKATEYDQDKKQSHTPRGGGGYSEFLYKRGLWLFFWFNILNFNIFLGFQKNEYIWGHEDFVNIFGGHHKIGLYEGVI